MNPKLQASGATARALFKRLFDEAAKDPGPVLPTYFVPRSAFIAECKKAGLINFSNQIQEWDWEDSIGLPEFAHKVFKQYHKDHGSDFTPMEKGAWRLYRKHKTT